MLVFQGKSAEIVEFFPQAPRNHGDKYYGSEQSGIFCKLMLVNVHLYFYCTFSVVISVLTKKITAGFKDEEHLAMGYSYLI